MPHTLFELHCGFYPQVSYREDVHHKSRSKAVEKLVAKLEELRAVCRKNLQHTQELKKQDHGKYSKPISYALGKKVWLNSKYINTKQNHKLEPKFFKPF